MTALAEAALPLPIDYADVLAARVAIGDAVIRTPCLHSRTLSEMTGAEVWLKFENLQFTAAYKERGALNKLLSLTEEQRLRGVIAASAGNHAQGLAYHAKRLGIPTTIVMPRHAPAVKVRQTEGHGASVILHGESFDDAAAHAHKLTIERHLTYVPPFDDALIMAGQGTVALEMLEDVPQLDTLIVPIGGGGLISGMATVAKTLKPDMMVVGVEAELYPSMYAKLHGQTMPCDGDTLAEGIAVKVPGELTFRVVEALVDDILLVGERDLERAVSLLLTIEKTVVEGAGAAGLAALLAHGQAFRGRKVGLVLCGATSTRACWRTSCCATSRGRGGWRGCASGSRTARGSCSKSRACSTGSRSTSSKSTTSGSSPRCRQRGSSPKSSARPATATISTA